MLSTSFAAFRKTPSNYFDRVIDNHETLIVNRGKDSAIVVLSIDDYISMVESCKGDTSELK
jgi:antitoxin YefM